MMNRVMNFWNRFLIAEISIKIRMALFVLINARLFYWLLWGVYGSLVPFKGLESLWGLVLNLFGTCVLYSAFFPLFQAIAVLVLPSAAESSHRWKRAAECLGRTNPFSWVGYFADLFSRTPSQVRERK